MEKKKKWIVIAGLLVVIGISFGLFFSLSDGEKEKEEAPEGEEGGGVRTQEETEELYEVIGPALKSKGMGSIHEGYGYEEEKYLTLNQEGDNRYYEGAPGDLLVWSNTAEKAEDVKAQKLSSGDELITLVKEKGSPFLSSGIHTLIVFYETETTIQGYVGEASVYKIKGNGELEKIFEPRGVFADIKKDKEGNLVVVEKVYKDEFGRYPTPLKPYELHYRKWEDNEWKTVQVEEKTPAIERDEKTKP